MNNAEMSSESGHDDITRQAKKFEFFNELD